MKLILLAISISCFLSCCLKEKSTKYEAFLINNTASHEIEISFYKSGVSNTIFLNPNDSIKIANGIDIGVVTSPGFTSEYFGDPNDSIIVTFDNQYTMTHYFNTPNKLSLKYLLASSIRNIGNPNSYVFIRNGNINSHYYYFNEQDYLDAR